MKFFFCRKELHFFTWFGVYRLPKYNDFESIVHHKEIYLIFYYIARILRRLYNLFVLSGGPSDFSFADDIKKNG